MLIIDSCQIIQTTLELNTSDPYSIIYIIIDTFTFMMTSSPARTRLGVDTWQKAHGGWWSALGCSSPTRQLTEQPCPHIDQLSCFNNSVQHLTLLVTSFFVHISSHCHTISSDRVIKQISKPPRDPFNILFISVFILSSGSQINNFNTLNNNFLPFADVMLPKLLTSSLCASLLWRQTKTIKKKLKQVEKQTDQQSTRSFIAR